MAGGIFFRGAPFFRNLSLEKSANDFHLLQIGRTRASHTLVMKIVSIKNLIIFFLAFIFFSASTQPKGFKIRISIVN